MYLKWNFDIIIKYCKYCPTFEHLGQIPYTIWPTCPKVRFYVLPKFKKIKVYLIKDLNYITFPNIQPNFLSVWACKKRISVPLTAASTNSSIQIIEFPMLHSKLDLYVLLSQLLDKESVNSMERLWECHQLWPLSILRVTVIEYILATFPKC